MLKKCVIAKQDEADSAMQEVHKINQALEELQNDMEKYVFIILCNSIIIIIILLFLYYYYYYQL